MKHWLVATVALLGIGPVAVAQGSLLVDVDRSQVQAAVRDLLGVNKPPSSIRARPGRATTPAACTAPSAWDR